MNDELKFNYDEVKNILCEACRLKVPETYYGMTGVWTHHLNGKQFSCTATEWRNRATRLVAAYEKSKEK